MFARVDDFQRPLSRICLDRDVATIFEHVDGAHGNQWIIMTNSAHQHAVQEISEAVGNGILARFIAIDSSGGITAGQ